MGDVGLAIQRAEDKTAQMQARAGAIDELLASGALEDHVGGGSQDYIQAELDKIGGGNDIESELARMKGEIAAERPQADRGQRRRRANGQAARPTPADQQAVMGCDSTDTR